MIMGTQMMIIEILKVNSLTKSVITVDGATEEEKEIAQHMAKNAINVVEKTTSKMYASPVTVNLSQSVTQEGSDRSQEKIDAVCMKLMSVMRTADMEDLEWSRSSHCSMLRNWS